MLFVHFDQPRHFVQRDLFESLPIANNAENLVNAGAEVRVGSEEVPHEVHHLVRGLALRVVDGCVYDAQLALFLERMVAIA